MTCKLNNTKVIDEVNVFSVDMALVLSVGGNGTARKATELNDIMQRCP
jgi:hypothetical protein